MRRHSARAYPSRPITIVVPLAAGTGMDVIARIYGEKLSQSLGKPVIIENKPGASLMLAAVAVASAPPDGHTLADLHQLRDVDQSDAVQADQLRSGKGLRPDLLVPEIALHPGRQSGAADPARFPNSSSTPRHAAVPLAYSSPGPGVAQHLVHRVHEAAFRPRHESHPVSQQPAIDHRYLRRPRASRLRRSRAPRCR